MFIERNLSQLKTPQSVPAECVPEMGIPFGGDR
jgi:hypothetical protein